jgi:hypothetical protein
MQQGGGGTYISQSTLIKTALEDFPHHEDLVRLVPVT